MTTVAHHPPKGYRTLRLPIGEHEYDEFISESGLARQRLEHLYWQSPELFPESFDQGYELYGFTAWSSKLDMRCRRLRLVANKVVYTVAPSFVIPYRRGIRKRCQRRCF